MMNYYAQLDADSICVGISALRGVVSSPSLVPIAHEDMTLIGRRRVGGTWTDPDPVVPDPVRILSRFAFRSRFTQEEKEAIYTAAGSAVQIRVWLDDLQAADYIVLDHPETAAGVQALEAAELIGAGRAAEILG